MLRSFVATSNQSSFHLLDMVSQWSSSQVSKSIELSQLILPPSFDSVDHACIVIQITGCRNKTDLIGPEMWSTFVVANPNYKTVNLCAPRQVAEGLLTGTSQIKLCWPDGTDIPIQGEWSIAVSEI